MEQNPKTLRCGMVSIIGRPNTGKSTLLNAIVGEKVAIVSKVPQTTRNRVRGIYHDARGQIVFIDTPGWHLGKDELDRYMNDSSAQMMQDVDCIIYLVDTTRNVGEEEKRIAGRLAKTKLPIILGLNKVDVKPKYLPEYISFWEKLKGKPVTELKNFTLLPLSGAKRINIDKLTEVLFGYLPESPPLYPDDIVCDVPQKMAIADIIREKLYRLMEQEIPHAIGVFIEHMQRVKGNTQLIKALIYVETPQQKQIVIGKKGNILKDVGTKARKELEFLLDTKVYLEIHVKVSGKWRDNPMLLSELGYDV